MTMENLQGPDKENTRQSADPQKNGDIYQDIFENSGVAIVVIDNDGILVKVNARFEQLCGVSRDDLVRKKRLTDLVDPDDVEKLSRYTNDLMKQNGQVLPSCSFDLPGKDGIPIPMLMSIRRIPGTPHAIATLMENSVNKKLKEMLRTNDERYRALVNDLPIGVYRNKLEPPGRFLWGNPALIHMFGYESLSGLLKHPVLEAYVNPEDRDRFLNAVNENGMVRNFEVAFKKKDGSHFRARVYAQTKKNAQGRIEWIEGTVEDLTNERTAQETEQMQYRLASAAFDSVSEVALCTTDLSGIVTMVNPGVEWLLGYTARELAGKQTPLIFFSGPELTARGQVMSEEAGNPVTGLDILTLPALKAGYDESEWTFIHKNTRRIRVSLAVSPLHSKDGGHLGYLFAAKEITSIREQEDAFRNSCLQMSGVIYNLPDAIFAIDKEGNVIAWNRAMEAITGIKAPDIIGKGNYEYALPFYGSRRPLLIDLLSATDAQIEDLGYCAIQRRGSAIMADTPILDPQNTLRVIWALAAPIIDTEGNRIGAIESLADITRRRQLEIALEDTVMKFREILDNTGSAIAVIEEDDTISYVNPEFGRIFGYVREEIEWRKKWMEFIVPDDVRNLREHWQKDVWEADGPVRFEVRFIRWDGNVRNAFFTITGIPKTRRLVAAILDITDKVRAETAIQLANQKHHFLNGVIRHDILNQLTVLKGNLELAREKDCDPHNREVLDKEITATNAIQALISFTRDYQDIGIEPPVWQDVRSSILKACTGMQLGAIMLSVEIEGVEIYADRLLSSVFFHLVQNAINHGKKTTQIRIFCQESFEELHIVCEDDGMGVPPEAKEKIFNRRFFSQTGLEMYLAHEILSISGISIREIGIYGEGACFEIRVPKGGYRFVPVPE